MEEQTLKAADNATKANEILAEVTAEPQEVEQNKITAPSDVLVNLPGGVLINGEVIKTAEVKELTGRDEEAIARATNVGKIFATVLARATKTVGNERATEDLLDRMLIGDRDALLLGIYRATFGDTAELNAWCNGCGDVKAVEINVLEDIKSKVLLDLNDATFAVKGKSHEYVVTLPTGITQKKILADTELSTAESMTILLEQTVLQIDSSPVYSKIQIQNLGLVDRRKIAEEISNRTPGPQFDDIKVTCPDCDSEVAVPINIGALFRF